MEDIIRTVKPYMKGLPFIVLAIVLAYVLANKYVSYVTPMYESTAKLKLADIEEGIPNSNLFKDLDVFATSNKIAGEIEVMQSEVLLDKVLDKLDFDIEIYRVGNIKTTELYDESPILVGFTQINETHYDAFFDIQLLDSIAYQLTSPSGEVLQAKLGDTIQIDESRIHIARNEAFLTQRSDIKLVDHYQFKHWSRQKLIEKVKKQLDISSVDKDVPVIRISYTSAKPKKAALLANTLAETYIEDYIQSKFQTADVTVDFLDGQIGAVIDKLTGVERKIQNFRDTRGIANIRQQTETDLRQIAQLKIQQTNLKMNLEAIRDLEAYVEAGKENFLDLAPNFEAFTDLLSTEMVKNIKSLQAEKKELLLTYTAASDQVQIVDKKMADLTAYLSESIRNTRKNLATKYERLSEDIANSEKLLVAVPENERMLTILNREFEIYQQSYNFLNEKKIEAEIARAADIAFHRVITPASVPKAAISPNGIIIKIVSMLLGMFGMIGLIFLFRLFFRKVENRYAIESSSLIPVASVIPKLKSSRAKTSFFQKESVQLELKGLLQRGDICCISSFKPTQGAGFYAWNFAKALIQQERHVLFVDVNDMMRNDNAVDTTALKIADNLDIVRLTHPKYSRFTREKWEAQLKEWQDSYELILVLNDEVNGQHLLPLMALASVNLIVLDAKKTPAKQIAQIDLLKEAYQLPNMHFVLNNNKISRAKAQQITTSSFDNLLGEALKTT